MDDQRDDRKGGSLKRLLLFFSIIPVSLLGIYLTVIASLGVGMAVRNYNPDMAWFFTAATLGFISGVAATITVTQAARRYKVSLTHFRIRDLFVLMTVLAFVFGLMSFVLNKK